MPIFGTLEFSGDFRVEGSLVLDASASRGSSCKSWRTGLSATPSCDTAPKPPLPVRSKA